MIFRFRTITACTRFVIAAAAIMTTGLGAQQPLTQDGLLARRAPAPIAASGTDLEQLQALLKRAWSLSGTTEPDKATALFDQARIEATRLGADRELGDALRGLATVHIRQYRDRDARPLLEQAVPLLASAGDELTQARALSQLGQVLAHLGEEARGIALLYEARDIFERRGELVDLARVYNRLVYLGLSGAEYDEAMHKGLAAAAKAGPAARGIDCSMLHEWGDRFFDEGNYAAAYTHLTDALTCATNSHGEYDAGVVLVSLGRVHRVHGQLDRALELYRQAFNLQTATHNEPAAIQSLNAIAATLIRMGRYQEGCTVYEQGAARAQQLGSSHFINLLTAGLGTCYTDVGRAEEGIALLEQVVAREKVPTRKVYELIQLAESQAETGRLEAAMTRVNEALSIADTSSPERRMPALGLRADVERRLGRFDEAEADLREAFTMIEDVREKTVPKDFMKRGFNELYKNWYDTAIALGEQRGDARGTLETAERARSRAFLDLMLSRGTTRAIAGMAAPAAIADNSTRTDQPRATQPDLDALALRGRGRQASAADVQSQDRPALDIPSPLSAAPPTINEMIATADRLHSTLLVYWVADATTFAWVITPDGQVHARTIEVKATHLNELVRATTGPLSSDASGGLALLGPAQTGSWRELYQLLIKPVREYLPTAPGSLLTVVPHGPLFQVSFAALQDDQGRYLIESYRLHYTPSVGVLAFTAQHQHAQPASSASKALLIGDPAPTAIEPGDDPLPPLPWARREVQEIGATFGLKHARIVTDREATEARVRKQIESADLLHFATHGVIRQTESMSSFLALARDPAASNGALTDGKLTADEVYGLRLHARLVVLSACGTALGPMTGDGVIGFTRAFLYAGAPSVIATEWNVPDRTGYEVMRRFYRFRKMTSDPSEALRDAQLSVLSALRKGTVRISLPGDGASQGTQVALRENPLFWAGFVLVGEP